MLASFFANFNPEPNAALPDCHAQLCWCSATWDDILVDKEDKEEQPLRPKNEMKPLTRRKLLTTSCTSILTMEEEDSPTTNLCHPDRESQHTLHL
jgi:hypothetical protein